MHKSIVMVLLVGLALGLPIGTFAQPSSVSYQGELLKDGLPWDQDADFKFAILSEGYTLWSNDGTTTGQPPSQSVTLQVRQGIFSTLLGAPPMVPLTAELLGGVTTAVLRVWVDTGEGFEQLSDQPLASAAFALVAAVGSDGETTYMAVPGEAFSASDTAYRIHRGSTFGVCFTEEEAYGRLEAPVLLPDGAQILRMTAYYWDESADSDLNVFMQRMVLGTGGIADVAEVTSIGSGGSGSASDGSITHGTVDNSQFSFAIGVTTTNGWVFTSYCGLGVRGVVIDYVLP